ncbi:MAG TPA: lysophospholipid acyltransferase family protein [Chthoniobacterales bacterium]|nr:lysophospholipid acyltransferase family protein [Chthoniobacterales bacterium]
MNPYYWVGYHLTKLLARIFLRLRVVHRERMINHGPVILAANHQSFLDPPLAGSTSNRAIYYLARRSLLKGWFLGWILPKLNVVPVDSETGKDRTALKALIRILRAGQGTLVFPEGQRSPDGKLQAAQPGLGLVIAKTLAPVVPIRIFGTYEAWPLHEKFPRPGRVTVVVGEPIFFTQADVGSGGKEIYQRLSQRVMDAIAAMKIE